MRVWLLSELVLSQRVLHSHDDLMNNLDDGCCWCQLCVSFAAGQRPRPCSGASARRRPVSKEARAVLLGLTLPLLVAALRQLHQQQAASPALNDLQGQYLADPPSQHLAVHPSQHLADLTSLEAHRPSVKEGAVLEVLVNLSLAVLVLAKTSPQVSVKQGVVQEVLINSSLADLHLAKIKAAPLGEDLAVEQVRHHLAQGLGSLLVGAQAKRKGLALTRATSRRLQHC